MDNGKVTALTLLDLSAAFDTIDHSFLLQRLHRYFGISGPALRWFKSFLSDRYQNINISGTLSSPQRLQFGVPQGSVLGPVMFSLYTTSLSQVIANRNLSHHLHADDTQVYISLSQSNVQESLSTLSDCLTYILSWMESSKLKLQIKQTLLLLLALNYNEIKSSTISQLNCLAVIHSHQILFAILVLSLTVTSTFASISLKYVNPVSIIFVIFVEFGVTYLYLLLKQYQRHLLAAALTIAIHY